MFKNWMISLPQSISVLCLLVPCPSVFAQVVRDSTLPINSVVMPNGNVNVITGGTRQGSNLFHSFKEFSVPSGSEVYFNNASSIQNIISRITGGSVSNIDGLIRANGTANFILLNPNGVFLGQNARLDIRGSVLLTTADSVKFADGIFGAKDPQKETLLTVNVPFGLVVKNPGAIQLQGSGAQIGNTDKFFLPTTIDNNASVVTAGTGKTIAFIGGNIDLNGSTIKANGGYVELGSVKSGNVGIISQPYGWDFNYQRVKDFQNINLFNRALVASSGTTNTSIHFQAYNLSLANGSVILLQNLGSSPSGNILVNASGVLDFAANLPNETNPNILRTEALANGRGGDIFIFAKDLRIEQGGGINTGSFTSAKGGDVIVNASDSVELLGVSVPNQVYRSDISANTFSSGNAGNIDLITNSLNAKGGALVQSTTVGTGDAGNVTVLANSINLSGVDISAPTVIGSTTFKEGNAGTVAINTGSLKLQEGAQINTSTVASGNAGSVNINAWNFVNVDGYDPKSGKSSNISSSAFAASPRTQRLFGSPAVPTGDSGDVKINTVNLSVSNRGFINVRNEGLGNAGKLQINTPLINLSDQGSITADTALGQGGDISLNSQDLRLNNATITASARGDKNGGNIFINTKTLLALHNSSIISNAVKGNGGNININAMGVFISPNSQISSTSQLGVNGTVTIITPNFDLSRSIITSTKFKNPDLSSGCRVGNGGNQLINVGSGGLPPGPSDAFNIVPDPQNVSSKETAASIIHTNNNFVEAQGWRLNDNKTLSLVVLSEAGSVVSPGLQNSSLCDYLQTSSSR
ncbi:two-partner secretion domain-containing protein [Nostoc sp.]|uniref:two-partner secretion domain-containing protein n=1 Tax=Nostoc sp. TaxID=1180 RepID=UPI002FF242D5